MPALVLSPPAAPARLEDFSGMPPAYSFVGDGEPFYAETVHYYGCAPRASRRSWTCITATYTPST